MDYGTYLQESHKTDEYYKVGTFWIVGKTIKDVLQGKLKIVGETHCVNYNGNMATPIPRNSLTHKRLWRDGPYSQEAASFTQEEKKDSYTYYPRGRLSIWNGEYYLFLPQEIFNNPFVIRALEIFYEISPKLQLNVEINEDSAVPGQATHYEFELK